MKLQTLTVIFIIIMLPITMVVSQYIKSEISTVNYQSQYDNKLNNATYDAIKSFQLNESNSSTANITSEKMRDVKASIKSFYNSLASGMGASGYSEEDLKYYIPCLVYTLYDGYYIYTSYEDNGKKEYGLKPYVYYTEKITGPGTNLTISYTLDSYVTIMGKLNGNNVSKSGYLYVGNKDINSSENLRENIDFNGELKYDVPYKYENFKNVTGVPGLTGQNMKYYYIDNKWYSYGTDGKLKEETRRPLLEVLGNDTKDTSAAKYLSQNSSFINDIKSLKNCTNSKGKNCTYLDIGTNNDPDDYTSEFNEHRREVIKETIRSNLTAAITNFKRRI